eukprot:TRINITY_DN18311_c0_g1_i2.p1 TRINITY_DN18311_c0_g1~~TRINITY_DN18311_c0_g1_i2.p1  ORF type:complete len:262 (+),score=50.13 TRINITY_DN18311_c0_g1_i2:1120-1905(+)
MLFGLCQDKQYGARVRSTCPQTCLMCVPVLTEEEMHLEEEERKAIAKGSGKFFDNWMGHYVHYAADVEFKATTTTTTEAPSARSLANVRNATGGEWDPTKTCEDQPNTDIKFKNGPRATCFELTNYCQHPALGEQVRNSCPETCGLCGIETRRQWIGNWMHANKRCHDLNITEQPQITLGGALAACNQLKLFCKGHPDSRYVLQKCAGTCELCVEKKVEVSTTTNIPFTFTQEVEEVQTKEYGCARRRRWGFCYTRRRRVH